jgi:hypothetical protein
MEYATFSYYYSFEDDPIVAVGSAAGGVLLAGGDLAAALLDLVQNEACRSSLKFSMSGGWEHAPVVKPAHASVEHVKQAEVNVFFF